ncbi:MAG: DUF1552 domain-containing protein [Pedosphaera sp.]|nr:DUF1552 domain-containing protein [Pedosphaera sp.]
MLEAMAPSLRAAAAAAGSASGGFPKRLAYVYVPNGKNMADWTPKSVGADFDLPLILEPLAGHRKHLTVITGLAHQQAYALGDGGGDHARATAAYLTGCHPKKTAGADLRLGISADQIAAGRIGRQTRLPSLELSCDSGKRTGACDTGYSCAYQFNLAWKSATQPVNPEVDPRAVFERLFGSNDPEETKEARAKRILYRKSILDFVHEDAKQFQSKLGATDRRKLDEYLTAVREIEGRLDRAEDNPPPPPESIVSKPGKFEKYEEHLRLMFDMLALAFQTDSTRISTFIMAHDGSNRPYPFIGVSEGHHELSHHRNDADKMALIAKINRFHTTQFAYFLDKLKAVKEGEGTLLDNCMIVYGSGISDGNSHSHEDLPVLLAGGGAGSLTPGRHLKLKEKTPMTNLHLSLLDRMGAPAERIGDSTGKLEVIG